MLRKFTRTEGTPAVVSPEAHKVIGQELNQLGKKTARDLSDSQREQIRLSLDESDDTC